MRYRLLATLPPLLIVAAFAAKPLFARQAAAPVDPRAGGLEIAFGEWTLVPEAKAIRPGKVTFVVTNRGRYAHGFRVRANDGGGGHDHIGKDRFEARTRVIRPGETVRLTVRLAAGSYRIDCFVEDAHGDHEELGMRSSLDVRADAPLVTPKPAAPKNQVRIAAFRYSPSPVTVKAGTTVKWTNDDAAKHTVSALDGSFTSKQLTKGQSYARKFTRTGTYSYLCALHPAMKAKLVVRK